METRSIRRWAIVMLNWALPALGSAQAAEGELVVRCRGNAGTESYLYTVNERKGVLLARGQSGHWTSTGEGPPQAVTAAVETVAGARALVLKAKDGAGLHLRVGLDGVRVERNGRIYWRGERVTNFDGREPILDRTVVLACQLDAQFLTRTGFDDFDVDRIGEAFPRRASR